MLGDGLSDDDDDTGGSELSDSGPSGLDLDDDEGDESGRGVGRGGREDDNELGSDDDF